MSTALPFDAGLATLLSGLAALLIVMIVAILIGYILWFGAGTL